MEPVGLGIGVLGLAGLFTSCIDCFNLVQRGRYLGRDYLILETKYKNQRLRLLTWGQACGLTRPNDPESDDSGGSRWDENVHSAVSETLLRIRSLFQDHRALRRRYGLTMDESNIDGSVAPPSKLRSMTSKLRATTFAVADMTQSALTTSPRPFVPKRRSFPSAVRWAVDDNRKFSELVQHLKDFIDDLEALTADLHARQRQRELIEVEVGSISDLSELETMEEARMGAIDAVADAASLRLCQINNLDIQLDLTEPLPWYDSTALGDSAPAQTPQTPQTPHTPKTPQTEDSEWDMVEPSVAPETDPLEMYYQVLYRVTCDAQPTMIFLDIPNYSHENRREPDQQWLVIDADAPLRDPAPLHLAGQRPLPNLEAYLNQNTHLSFLVIREYKCLHETGRRPCQPNLTQTCIRLTSDLLCATLNSWRLAARPPNFHRDMELGPPYTWFYHNRKVLTDPMSLIGPRPLDRHMAAAETLLEYIKACMDDLYSGLDQSLDGNGRVSWVHLPLIFVRSPRYISVPTIASHASLRVNILTLNLRPSVPAI